MIRVMLWFVLVCFQILLGSVAIAAQDVVYQCGDDGAETMEIDGCGFGDVIELPGLDFATGSAQLTTNAARILARLAKQLKKHASVSIEVAGHTDDMGSAENNRRLSQRRASTVRSYLILKGVDEQRLTARGYGESSPLADNGTAQGRKTNRRVELRIVNARNPDPS